MISDFVANIAESNLLLTFNNTTDILEASDLFGLHYQKCVIKRKKIDLLKERLHFKNVFVISNLSTYHNIDKTIDGNEVVVVELISLWKHMYVCNQTMRMMMDDYG